MATVLSAAMVMTVVPVTAAEAVVSEETVVVDTAEEAEPVVEINEQKSETAAEALENISGIGTVVEEGAEDKKASDGVSRYFVGGKSMETNRGSEVITRDGSKCIVRLRSKTTITGKGISWNGVPVGATKVITYKYKNPVFESEYGISENEVKDCKLKVKKATESEWINAMGAYQVAMGATNTAADDLNKSKTDVENGYAYEYTYMSLDTAPEKLWVKAKFDAPQTSIKVTGLQKASAAPKNVYLSWGKEYIKPGTVSNGSTDNFGYRFLIDGKLPGDGKTTSANGVYMEGAKFAGFFDNLTGKKVSKIDKKLVEDSVISPKFTYNQYVINYKMTNPDKSVKIPNVILPTVVSWEEEIEFRGFSADYEIDWDKKTVSRNYATCWGRDGYRLIGWTDDKKGTTVKFNIDGIKSIEDRKDSDGDIYKTSVYYQPSDLGFTSKKGGKITLYPVWEKVNK